MSKGIYTEDQVRQVLDRELQESPYSTRIGLASTE